MHRDWLIEKRSFGTFRCSCIYGWRIFIWDLGWVCACPSSPFNCPCVLPPNPPRPTSQPSRRLQNMLWLRRMLHIFCFFLIRYAWRMKTSLGCFWFYSYRLFCLKTLSQQVPCVLHQAIAQHTSCQEMACGEGVCCIARRLLEGCAARICNCCFWHQDKRHVDVEFSCDVLSFFVHVACHTFRICMLDGVLGND